MKEEHKDNDSVSDQILDRMFRPGRPLSFDSSIQLSEKENCWSKGAQAKTQKIVDKAPVVQDIDKNLDEQLSKRWGFWEKVVDRGTYEKTQHIKKQLMGLSAEARQKQYKTIMETRLVVLRERCDAATKLVKGEIRTQFSVFLMEKLAFLSDEIAKHQVLFSNRMKRKHNHLSTLDGYPSLQERYTESILNEELRHFDFLDTLLEKFMGLIDEAITKY